MPDRIFGPRLGAVSRARPVRVAWIELAWSRRLGIDIFGGDSEWPLIAKVLVTRHRRDAVARRQSRVVNRNPADDSNFPACPLPRLGGPGRPGRLGPADGEPGANRRAPGQDPLRDGAFGGAALPGLRPGGPVPRGDRPARAALGAGPGRGRPEGRPDRRHALRSVRAGDQPGGARSPRAGPGQPRLRAAAHRELPLPPGDRRGAGQPRQLPGRARRADRLRSAAGSRLQRGRRAAPARGRRA